jgi:hypothetical protein
MRKRTEFINLVIAASQLKRYCFYKGEIVFWFVAKDDFESTHTIYPMARKGN